MNSVTHMIIGGLTGGLTLAVAISARESTLDFFGYVVHPVMVTAGAVIGGLAPDVDMKRSVSGKIMRNILRFSLAISALVLAAMFLLPRIGSAFPDGIERTYPIILAVFCIVLLVVIEKSKHRGFTHTMVSLLIVSAPVIYIPLKGVSLQGVNFAISAQIGFILGWFSHMVADTFNYPGVPWLWPFTSNHLNIARVDSGTKEEVIFCDICVVAFVVAYALIIF